MATKTTNLILFQDLENSNKTKDFSDSELRALNTVAGWIKTFVAMPNTELGRAGPVCPFVSGSLERRTLWFATEQIHDRSVPDVVQLVNHYKRLLLHTQPTGGENAIYKAIMVVFPDLSADRAKDFFDDHQIQRLKKPFYAEDGVVLGEFHERNEGSAIYNSSFQPFQAPVPFLLMRLAVVNDWKFFVDNEEWLGIWARRFGESATLALGAELHRINWPHLKL